MVLKLPFQPRILADSYNNLYSSRVTSVITPFPTVKLAELRTGRKLAQSDDILGITEYIQTISMNANSSRAIPVEKIKDAVIDHPYIPTWTENKSGMSGNIIEDEEKVESITEEWLRYRDDALYWYNNLKDDNIHKQNLNLLFHPFAWSTVIITADMPSWEHHFELRLAPDTYPDFKEIFGIIYDLYINSDVITLNPGEWHIPFKEQFEDSYTLKEKLLVSASCCARISYDNDREETLEKHIKRANWCIEGKHASVFEHQLKAPTLEDIDHLEERLWYNKDANLVTRKTGKYFSNIKGWVQLRKVVESGEFEDVK